MNLAFLLRLFVNRPQDNSAGEKRQRTLRRELLYIGWNDVTVIYGHDAISML